MKKIKRKSKFYIIRHAANMGIKEVTSYLNVTSSYITGVENGNKFFSSNLEQKYADLFGVPVEDFKAFDIKYSPSLPFENRLEAMLKLLIKDEETIMWLSLSNKQHDKEDNIYYLMRKCTMLSVNDLAKEFNVTRPYINYFEKGIRPVPMNMKEMYSNFFHVPLNEIEDFGVYDEFKSFEERLLAVLNIMKRNKETMRQKKDD